MANRGNPAQHAAAGRAGGHANTSEQLRARLANLEKARASAKRRLRLRRTAK